MAARKPKAAPSRIEYVLGKGTSRLLNARIDKEEIHLIVNGPAMLYDQVRILTSLDMADGATFQAWTRLANGLSCTSYCGRNGVTKLSVTVDPSRIGTGLKFSTGPMSMYQSLVVLRPRKKGQTMKKLIDESFNYSKTAFSVLMIPEAAEGHMEHDASIFESGVTGPSPSDDDSHHHEHHH